MGQMSQSNVTDFGTHCFFYYLKLQENVCCILKDIIFKYFIDFLVNQVFNSVGHTFGECLSMVR